MKKTRQVKIHFVKITEADEKSRTVRIQDIIVRTLLRNQQDRIKSTCKNTAMKPVK